MSRHGTFTWFELVTDDIEDARAFHSSTLGWAAMDMPMGDHTYAMLAVDDAPQAGLVRPTLAGPSHWLSYLSVDDVDQAAQRVGAHGGTVVVAPTDIDKVGRLALVADPQGARFNLFRGINDDGGSTDVHWNELWSPEPEAVLPFYREVFGFEVQSMEMQGGTYYILKNGQGGQGGVMASPDKNTPPMWLPYIKLDDCDAAVARATERGGAITLPPMTVEGIGRIAVITDRAGAPLGLITPAQ